MRKPVDEAGSLANRRAFGARTKCARPCVGVRAPLFSATNSKRCEDTSQSKSTACEMQRNPNRRDQLPRFADHQDPKFFVLAMFNNWVGKRQNVTVASLEQVWLPTLHTWYVKLPWPWPPMISV